jgi:hypothetical protein
VSILDSSFAMQYADPHRSCTASVTILLQLVAACWILLSSASISAAAQIPDEPSVLPFTTTDRVVVLKTGTFRERTLSGVIENLSGQNIVLRRNGNTVDILKLREVTSIDFHKSPEFSDGLRKLEQRQWQTALKALQDAATTEPRDWAVREILAGQAVAFRALGRFEECLKTVEQIYKDDPNTRHLVELPLVWDERLPAADRFQATPDDLQSESVLRKLTAASALLQDPEHETAALAAFSSVRRTPHIPVQELAELQLWRRSLIHPDQVPTTYVEQWAERARNLDRRMRSGPEFLIGRALAKDHDYDKACASLLWMPLLEPLDPPTTAASFRDAIEVLKRAGRIEEAAQFQRELDALKPPGL